MLIKIAPLFLLLFVFFPQISFSISSFSKKQKKVNP